MNTAQCSILLSALYLIIFTRLPSHNPKTPVHQVTTTITRISARTPLPRVISLVSLVVLNPLHDSANHITQIICILRLTQEPTPMADSNRAPPNSLPRRDMSKNINILQWNCQGLRSKLPFLQNIAQDFDCKIYLLSGIDHIQ